MKKYNFYFHDDVDGLTCAALFYDFIKTRGGLMGELHPLSYVPNFNDYCEPFKFVSPAVLLDFRYHPKADWFFDHHPTSFLTNEWKETFKETPQHKFSETYPSCFGLVFDSLVREHGYKPTPYLQKIRRDVDMLDSAKYPSAKYYILLEGPIVQLDMLISRLRSSGSVPHAYLIKALATKSLTDILRLKKYRRIIHRIRREIQRSLTHLPNVISIENNVALTDATLIKTYVARFGDYYLYPDLEYSITLKYVGDEFGLSVGKNPWSSRPSAIHIGEVMQRFGGGGHRNAGGCEMDSKHALLEAAHVIRSEIVKALKEQS